MGTEWGSGDTGMSQHRPWVQRQSIDSSWVSYSGYPGMMGVGKKVIGKGVSKYVCDIIEKAYAVCANQGKLLGRYCI